jgi:hypothetical protein
MIDRFWKFILDMHGSESSTSWMRWMGTLVIGNIMTVWTFSCIFGDGFQIHFTLEDMPLGLVGIITTMIVGKVGQAAVENKNGKPS